MAILPTASCTEVTMTTIEEHIDSSSDAVVVRPNKKLSQCQLLELLSPSK